MPPLDMRVGVGTRSRKRATNGLSEPTGRDGASALDHAANRCRRRWRDLHERDDPDVVCRHREAGMEPAALAVRPSMDVPLHHDGLRGLAGVAIRSRTSRCGRASRQDRPPCVRSPTRGKRRVVADILRGKADRPRAGSKRVMILLIVRNDPSFLSGDLSGGSTDRSLSHMSHLRDGPERDHLAAQPVAP